MKLNMDAATLSQALDFLLELPDKVPCTRCGHEVEPYDTGDYDIEDTETSSFSARVLFISCPNCKYCGDITYEVKVEITKSVTETL